MIYRIFPFFILFVVLTSSSCEDKYFERTEYIYIENLSTNRVYVSAGIGIENGGLDFYPDSILTVEEPFLREVMADSTEVLISTVTVEDYYDQILVNNVLSVYVFDADQLDTLGWAVIRDSNYVEQRYDLTLEDVQSMGFNVVYP